MEREYWKRKWTEEGPFMSSFIFAFSVFSYMLEHVQRAYVPMSLHFLRVNMPVCTGLSTVD